MVEFSLILRPQIEQATWPIGTLSARETIKPSCTRGLGALFAVLLGTLATSAARADLIFETNFGSAPQGSGTTIGEYTTAEGR